MNDHHIDIALTRNELDTMLNAVIRHKLAFQRKVKRGNADRDTIRAWLDNIATCSRIEALARDGLNR